MKKRKITIFSTLLFVIALVLSIISIRAYTPSSNGDDNVEVASTLGANQIEVSFEVYDGRYEEDLSCGRRRFRT